MGGDKYLGVGLLGGWGQILRGWLTWWVGTNTMKDLTLLGGWGQILTGMAQAWWVPTDTGREWHTWWVGTNT